MNSKNNDIVFELFQTKDKECIYSKGYRSSKRGPYDGQRIVNIYCGNCLLASYNNLKIAITKNKKLENYYCGKCNSNEHIYMEVYSYPDGGETRCWVLHVDSAEVDYLEIDDVYELGP